jgi:hypothetical protein
MVLGKKSTDGQGVVTSVGLRNLTGRVDEDGSVTLWATTSTSSASGDNGADPNKVVRITDELAATSMTSAVAQETFTTVAGPTYGTVYRGVVYVAACGGDDRRRDDCRHGRDGHDDDG